MATCEKANGHNDRGLLGPLVCGEPTLARAMEPKHSTGTIDLFLKAIKRAQRGTDPLGEPEEYLQANRYFWVSTPKQIYALRRLNCRCDLIHDLRRSQVPQHLVGHTSVRCLWRNPNIFYRKLNSHRVNSRAIRYVGRRQGNELVSLSVVSRL